MDYKELAEICGYLSDTPSYTAFHDKVERDVICNSCKGGLCYEKVQDAHWCMYEALQRAAVAITGLLARAEAAEARAEKAEEIASDLCDDFTDFVTGGIHNAAPYCANCRPECVNAHGWCNGDNKVCRGFMPKAAVWKEE